MDDTIGKRLKLFLKSEFGTQRSLAAKLGITESEVSDWVKDKVRPSVDTLLRLQDLGLSIDWLLTGRGDVKVVAESRTRAVPLPPSPSTSQKRAGSVSDEDASTVTDARRRAELIARSAAELAEIMRVVEQRMIEIDHDGMERDDVGTSASQ